MKKSIILTVSIALVASLSLSLSTGLVRAADENATKQSNTKVAVQSGTLAINSVPDFSFNSTVAEIANNDTTVAVATPGTIETADNRGLGTDTNWSLSAVPTQLRDAKGHVLKASSLIINGKVTNTIDGTTGVEVNNGVKEGTIVTQITTANTSLALEKDDQVFAGDYSGTITWTLSGAPADAANPAE